MYGERELHLVLLFDGADQADPVMREIGSPWMREHVVGLLSGPIDRRTGDVIASSLA